MRQADRQTYSTQSQKSNTNKQSINAIHLFQYQTTKVAKEINNRNYNLSEVKSHISMNQPTNIAQATPIGKLFLTIHKRKGVMSVVFPISVLCVSNKK